MFLDLCRIYLFVVGVVVLILISLRIATRKKTYLSKEEKIQRKKIKKEMRDLRKFTTIYSKQLKKLPLPLIKNRFAVGFEEMSNGKMKATPQNIVALKCEGRVIIKRMNIKDNMTLQDLYNYLKFEATAERFMEKLREEEEL